MKWTYDPQADAIYLALDEGGCRLVSVSIGDQVILDVDQRTGELSGIEILGVQDVFPRLRRLLAEEPRILGGDEGGAAAG